MTVPGLAALLLIQLPGDTPGKAGIDGPSIWVPETLVADPDSWLLASALASPTWMVIWETKHCFFLPLSHSPFQIKKSILKI